MSPFFRPRKGQGLHHDITLSRICRNLVAVPVRGAGCILDSLSAEQQSVVAVPVRGAGCIPAVRAALPVTGLCCCPREGCGLHLLSCQPSRDPTIRCCPREGCGLHPAHCLSSFPGLRRKRCCPREGCGLHPEPFYRSFVHIFVAVPVRGAGCILVHLFYYIILFALLSP